MEDSLLVLIWSYKYFFPNNEVATNPVKIETKPNTIAKAVKVPNLLFHKICC